MTAALVAARRLVVFSRGHSSALAEFMVRRLVRSGYEAVAPTNVDWEAPEQLARLQAGDVLLVFAFRGLRAEVERLLAFAHQRGVRTVLIGDFIGTSVREKPGHLLLAPRGEEGEYQSFLVPMAICSILILELTRRDEGRSIRALERIGEVKEMLAAARRNLP